MPTNPTNCNNCGCTPNPLDSGNWESESTARSASTSTTPPDGSPSGGGECKVGFKDGYVCKPFQDGTYDAGANLHPDTNCRAEDLVFAIQGDAEGAEIDSASGVVTFGPTSALIIISVACGNIGDTMTLRYAKIEWIESEVVLEWYEQPSGVYSAASNVDTTNGGAMPDHWSIQVENDSDAEDVTDATIGSTTGVVTYGSAGQSCEITGTVDACGTCGAKFKAEIVKLAISRDGEDVTNKTTNAFVGETVSLGGVVTPKKFGGTDWDWSVPAITVKDFKVTDGNTKGTREDYVPADWKKQVISVHWVDGKADGENKIVTVSATVNGKRMTAKTTIKVKRPEANVIATNRNARIEWSGQFSQWGLTTDVDFTRDPITEGGSAHWIQLGTMIKGYETVTGTSVQIPLPPPDGTSPGLDTCRYPTTADKDMDDRPFSGLPAGIKWKSVNYTMKTWLMWKPPKPGVWVPLRSSTWWFRGTILSTGQPNNQQQKPVWKDLGVGKKNPDFGITGSINELSYPEWTKCLNPKED